jgi:hypothetical protein
MRTQHHSLCIFCKFERSFNVEIVSQVILFYPHSHYHGRINTLGIESLFDSFSISSKKCFKIWIYILCCSSHWFNR